MPYLLFLFFRFAVKRVCFLFTKSQFYSTHIEYECTIFYNWMTGVNRTRVQVVRVIRSEGVSVECRLKSNTTGLCSDITNM